MATSLWRNKPVTVEARQFDVPPDRLPMPLGIELAEWCGGKFLTDFKELGRPRVEFPAPEDGTGTARTMTAFVGDWIVKDAEGAFYAFSQARFEAIFEPVEADGEAERHPDAAGTDDGWPLDEAGEAS